MIFPLKTERSKTERSKTEIWNVLFSNGFGIWMFQIRAPTESYLVSDVNSMSEKVVKWFTSKIAK